MVCAFLTRWRTPGGCWVRMACNKAYSLAVPNNGKKHTGTSAYFGFEVGLAFTPPFPRFALATTDKHRSDKTVHLWSVASGQCVAKFEVDVSAHTLPRVPQNTACMF